MREGQRGSQSQRPCFESFPKGYGQFRPDNGLVPFEGLGRLKPEREHEFHQAESMCAVLGKAGVAETQ